MASRIFYKMDSGIPSKSRPTVLWVKDPYSFARSLQQLEFLVAWLLSQGGP
jgi:hypothetical protein